MQYYQEGLTSRHNIVTPTQFHLKYAYWDIDPNLRKFATYGLLECVSSMLVIRLQEKKLSLLVLGFQTEDLN